MQSGIKIIEEIVGAGAQVAKGDSVVFDCAASLSKGTRVHGRQTDSTVLGARRLIPGIEDALINKPLAVNADSLERRLVAYQKQLQQETGKQTEIALFSKPRAAKLA